MSVQPPIPQGEDPSRSVLHTSILIHLTSRTSEKLLSICIVIPSIILLPLVLIIQSFVQAWLTAILTNESSTI